MYRDHAGTLCPRIYLNVPIFTLLHYNKGSPKVKKNNVKQQGKTTVLVQQGNQKLQLGKFYSWGTSTKVN